MTKIDAISTLLDEAVRSGHPPAAQACAIVDGRVVHESVHGASPDGSQVSCASVFDVASVTKLAVTTLSMAHLVERGELVLDAPVARWIPAFAANGKGGVTVRELLGHRSGLPAWSPLFTLVLADPRTRGLFLASEETLAPDAWAIARETILSSVLGAPIGSSRDRVYSDLGFIALGALVETVGGASLHDFANAHVFAPLGVGDDAGFVDLSAPSSWLDSRHVLPTGRTRPREPAPGQEALYSVPPQPLADDAGRVDDDNAFAMGGISGHAGLFATARALASLGWSIVEELEGAARLGSGATLRTFAAPDPLRSSRHAGPDPSDGAPRGLGFDRPALQGSSAGSLIGRGGPRGAIGHIGFTGCSLWIDLDRRLAVALLTNRTYPGRRFVEPIRTLRPAIHDALCRAIA